MATVQTSALLAKSEQHVIMVALAHSTKNILIVLGQVDQAFLQKVFFEVGFFEFDGQFHVYFQF